MRKQQSSFQWVAHDAVRTTLLHVGGVSLDVPGTLMQAGGREGRKQGGELEWAALPVLRCRCRLNFKHRLLFTYIWLVQSERTGLSGHQWVCCPQPAENMCTENTQKQEVTFSYKMEKPSVTLFCSVCRFPVRDDFWDGALPVAVQRVKVEMWTCQETDRSEVKLLSASCCRVIPSAVLIYCPSPQRRSCKQLLQENFLREVGKPVFRISK